MGKWKNGKDKWLIKEMTEIFWFSVGGKKLLEGTSKEKVTLQAATRLSYTALMSRKKNLAVAGLLFVEFKKSRLQMREKRSNT